MTRCPWPQTFMLFAGLRQPSTRISSAKAGGGYHFSSGTNARERILRKWPRGLPWHIPPACKRLFFPPACSRTFLVRNVQFHTTVIPDTLALRWVYRFLDNPHRPERGRNFPQEPIVFLHESNTGFGQAVSSDAVTLRKLAR